MSAVPSDPHPRSGLSDSQTQTIILVGGAVGIAIANIGLNLYGEVVPVPIILVFAIGAVWSAGIFLFVAYTLVDMLSRLVGGGSV